jgi:ribosome-binding protein aMBF1 (putative translation factor)
MTTSDDGKLLMKEVDRELLRSSLVSIFYDVFSARKKHSGLTYKELAESLKVNKSQVSRWFSSLPNWELNTVSDIANALDVELVIEAIDRQSGTVYSKAGSTHSAQITSSGQQCSGVPLGALSASFDSRYSVASS